ncbi:hypothetical protein F2P44_31205 [Massilia sp. CCM 8695]|uniref:Uncharacterized protein n=1 Tax=Massilia frigida TaxID=2609281 RepID=A0ABX0NE03_9BURK|nr:hypothetical protein [Massilia frigida]NHZ83702.1 hypothetical protein [Massilia frigida]
MSMQLTPCRNRDATAILRNFCRAHVCTPDLVSADGAQLDLLMVFALMRRRGYHVSEPRRPQQQLNRKATTWLVDVTLPAGTSVQLAFPTSNTP